ncbi:MAG: hypothetical protein M1837_002680 [Sclerophora amabilis]|nr:MAG: hypothetical protein M1837_002680 [Sclerophora amabilis]
MASLDITDSDIPDCTGKTVVITGGCSGIGLSAGIIFASHGAKVFLLDVNAPQNNLPANAEYIACNVTRWADLIAAFEHFRTVDIAIANAGVSEEVDFFQDTIDSAGNLVEPGYRVVDVNLRGTLNFIKFALSNMRQHHAQGSIVITSSATAYSPEQSLPVYSGSKFALIGVMRALRSRLPREGITINAVAPAATITSLLPPELAAPIMAAGLPVSTSEFVGLAVAYSAVATESRQVELYGKDSESKDRRTPRRWNGRTILTLGDKYTELEEPTASLKPQWLGSENTRQTRLQQAATDFRQ